MKKIKRILTILILTIIFAFVCTGCDTTEGSKSYEKHSNLKETGIKNLYYDPNTQIVYILFNEHAGYSGYGYMSPYYAANGKPYLWENGLKEIR